ncbi:fibronectin-like isoform X1 [Acropora millepora]|uniref:fibronectin-like isoform X1 n=1 Tax=Acropora millepora TaxID=45264 RepID=UPI001CF137F5|nr:fibronectin-like isoform X1 [Acropora millepora]
MQWEAYFVALFSCLLQVSVCEKGVACKQRTITNHCCRLPFYYNGTKYRRCTSHGDIHNRFWCATDLKYSKNHGAGWGYCKLPQCFIKTITGECCIFPFKYNGIEYNSCVSPQKFPRIAWCATQHEFNRSVNGSGWGYCAGATCFECRSTISMEHCKSNLERKTCSFGVEHCITVSRQNKESAHNITRVFKKDCATKPFCSKSNLFCNELTSGEDKCTHRCCHGELCNLAIHGKGRSFSYGYYLVRTLSFVLTVRFGFS